MKEGVKCLATRRSISLIQSANILKASTEKHKDSREEWVSCAYWTEASDTCVFVLKQFSTSKKTEKERKKGGRHFNSCVDLKTDLTSLSLSP